MVEAQQTTEAVSPRHRCVVVGGCGERRDQPVVEPLVIALEMVVLYQLVDGETKMSLAERSQLVQALTLDRQHETFGESIQIGLCAGSFRHRTPATLRLSRNSCVKSGSRSWIRSRLPANDLRAAVEWSWPTPPTRQWSSSLPRESRRSPPLRPRQRAHHLPGQSCEIATCVVKSPKPTRSAWRSPLTSPSMRGCFATSHRPALSLNPKLASHSRAGPNVLPFDVAT
jgi:hypothetical protein